MWLTVLKTGVRNLLLHKLRSFLTMLGTILGVASVIAMLAIGEGSKRHALDQIRQLGAANVIVRSIKPDLDNDVQSSSQTNTIANTNANRRVSRVLEYGLLHSDLDKLTATIPHIDLAVPIAMVRKKRASWKTADHQRPNSWHHSSLRGCQKPIAGARAIHF